ncbi:NADH-quinone oxidoreductase subunit J [Sanguibacter sp. HDW7]|uniref:NADH-quinone oxidoreductase subunit J n=1 Tax=Sanguibacter sp. HDW7 TaxID=2714931 RepID=UPI00351B9BE9
MTSTGEAVLFWVIAPAMVLGALGLVFARKAVYAALSMILVMVSLAVVYVMQQAEFLGIVQVVVYTGAVMMLFVFVLMLVGVDASTSAVETIKGQRWIGILMGVGTGTLLVTVTARAALPATIGLDEANSETNPAGLARILMSDFVLDLEIVAALLVTAALAALVLTHRRRLTPKIGQPERAAERLRAGEHIVNLPAPGVYARHNAMDVPALDPEGNPIEASVSRVLRIRGQEHGLDTDVTTLVAARATAELTTGDQATDTAAERGGHVDDTDAATTEGEA